VADEVIVHVSDPDAAVRDALDGRASRTRRELIRHAVVTGGTLALGGVTIAGIPRLAHSAPSPSQDVRILNLVLVLEWLEDALHNGALNRGGLTGELRQYAKVVGSHERAHVAFIERTLGKAVRKQPTFELGDTVSDPKKFTAAALALEDLSVAAYNGQAANLTPGALAAAARIVSVEARHAAWIRFIAGMVPAPDPTDAPATADQVTARLRKTGLVKLG
jgi:Ferritin-like domain